MPIDPLPTMTTPTTDPIALLMSVVVRNDGAALATMLHELSCADQSERVLGWAQKTNEPDIADVLLRGGDGSTIVPGYCRPREAAVRRVLMDAAADIDMFIDPSTFHHVDPTNTELVKSHRMIQVLTAHCDGPQAVTDLLAEGRGSAQNMMAEIVGLFLSDAAVRSLTLSSSDCGRAPHLAERWRALRNHDTLTAVAAIAPKRRRGAATARRM